MTIKALRAAGIFVVAAIGCSAQTARTASVTPGSIPPQRPATDIHCSTHASLRMATVAPRGTSVHRALQAMGQKWKQCGVDLTIYTGGEMSGEAEYRAANECGADSDRHA